MKKLLYFAYGSNMLLSRLESRVDRLGEVKVYGTHALVGYRLTFNCGFRKHSYANIVKCGKEHCVEGVLYELNQEQIATLNKYENYPYNYEQQFFTLPDGNIAFAYVSVSDFFTSNALPEIDYLNTLIQGALEHELYATYNTLVNFKNKNYSLKKGNKFKVFKDGRFI